MAAPQAARTQEKLATARMQPIAGTPTTVRMPATSETKATAENASDTRDSPAKAEKANNSENIRN